VEDNKQANRAAKQAVLKSAFINNEISLAHVTRAGIKI
jgi:hypothetical protein